MSRATSNKSAGTWFEREMAQVLHENGFWVHRFQDNVNGQPCDLIAARDGRAFLIDCKDCVRGVFSFSRIEENQVSAMRAFERAGNEPGWFALRAGGTVHMIGIGQLDRMERAGEKRMDMSDMARYGMGLKEWLKSVKEVRRA